jgi:YidC/Oxa1 family membrane protein insertase
MADNPMAQQQKILLYVMPVFLAVISFQFPLGVLLYWVTTNFWQIVQQAIILREGAKVDAAYEKKRSASSSDDTPPPAGPARGATSGRKRTWDETRGDRGRTSDEAGSGDGNGADSAEGPTGSADADRDPDDSPDDSQSVVEEYSKPLGRTEDAVTGRRRLPRRGGSA